MIKAEAAAASASPHAKHDGNAGTSRKRKARSTDDSSSLGSGDSISCAFRGPIVARVVEIGIPLASANHQFAYSHGKEEAGQEQEHDMMSITVYEAARPSELLETWAMSTCPTGGIPTSSSSSNSNEDATPIHDPCGTIMWPGSILAGREMNARKSEIVGKTVLILGAGTGLEAQVAANLGAACVIATDVNQQSLDLLDYGAAKAGLGDIITSRIFDLFGDAMLPVEADIILAADVMYNAELSVELGKRVLELISRKGGAPGVIVVDSQRFGDCDFLPALDAELVRANHPRMGQLEWESKILKDVTTSAFSVDEDETFTKSARVLTF